MDVAAVTAANASAATKSEKKIAEDFDNFLILLTTQLKNQDPLEPLDTNEFTAQLVRFTTVEQSIAANKNLETLINLTSASQTATAVAYLGTRIEAEGAQNSLTENGAEWTYTLPSEAEQTTILVKNAAGSIVFSTSGELTAGKHSFTWNGQLQNGSSAAEGVYSIQVTSTDSSGDMMSVKTGVVGLVTGAETIDGKQMLAIGGAKVPMDGITAVSVG